MFWFVLAHLVTFLVDLLTGTRHADCDKDLQIALLQHQLRLLQRQRPQPRLTRWEKLTLAVLTTKLARLTAGPRSTLEQYVLLFKPDTVVKWHRELVRRKWTCRRQGAGGRPTITAEVEQLLLRLARENPRWGYGRLQGELSKLGHPLGRSTVRDVLRRHRLPPVPTRRRQPSTWRAFLRRHQDQLLACDFFTVETLCLKTVYVLFFIELSTRRVHLAGCTTNPSAAWVTQQARHISWKMQDGAVTTRFLIHDRDTKFPAAFDTIFMSQDITIIRTPLQAPNANAFAERWVRSVREECVDKILILGEGHLHRVLNTYVDYYNCARPHQGINQRCPVSLQRSTARDGPIARRDILGGVLHDYYRRAA